MVFLKSGKWNRNELKARVQVPHLAYSSKLGTTFANMACSDSNHEDQSSKKIWATGGTAVHARSIFVVFEVKIMHTAHSIITANCENVCCKTVAHFSGAVTVRYTNEIT